VSRKTLFLITICVLVSASAHLPILSASVIEKSVDFTPPIINYTAGTASIMVDNLPLSANTGEPLLPVYTLQILLPQGEEVANVAVVPDREEAMVLDMPLELARSELPTDSIPGLSGTPEQAAPSEPAFDLGSAFPSERSSHIYTGTYRGYNIAFINLYPVTYTGASRTAHFAGRLTVRVETRADASALERSRETLRVGAAGDLSILSGLTDDPSARATYVASPFPRLGASLVAPGDFFPYVIITSSALQSAFEPLRLHRTQRGLRARTVLVSDIAATYAGADLQAKIREFIRDAYLNWGTEYVLLAGDNDVIPHRGLYAVGPSAIDADIASDLYYAALDGTWNDDGDSYWGEPAEADLLPEVMIGRAAVGDTVQAANFVAKVMRYEESPVVGQIETGEMLGEALSAGTWGGDYKDEVKDGASAFGYTTAGFPATFDVGTLYDRDLPQPWDKWDLIAVFNAGTHLVNHIGHANVTYGLRMFNADVETTLTNDGVSATYFIAYSQGCYAASFDNRSPTGYGDDCIGEHFTFVRNGAVAFIGNSRYGWYMPYSTNGTSQHYDRQFFDAIFGENKTELGEAFRDQLVDNIALIGFGAMRWAYYDLVLLGDPAMDIWTGVPGDLTVGHPERLYVSDNEVEISVESPSGPVAGARVSIFSDSTSAMGYTDTGGIARLDPAALVPGELALSVSAHNFYAYLDTIPVEQADRPVLVIEGVSADDDSLGQSWGNSNGRVDAGEGIESRITLANVGQDSALGVSAVLRTSDSFVTILDSTGTYGDIPPDSAVTPPWSFLYQVSSAAPDGHVAQFDVAVTGLDTTVVRHCSAVICAPEIGVAGITTADSLYGNGDRCIGPGETFEVTVVLTNSGSADGLGAAVTVDADDPYLTVERDSAFVGSLPAGEETAVAPSFLLALSRDCPEFYRVDLGLSVVLANGRTFTDTLSVYLGGSLDDDVESGAPGWTHAGFGDTRVDQWHLETYRNHTPGGTYAWKFGGVGSSGYSDFAHSALETPELCLGPGATLSFWHWIHAELNINKYAWDGGIVEISTDGGTTWSQIAPVGGYYYKIYSNFFSPFPAETPCFAWTNDWVRVEFDLSAFQGPARIRFRFGSDQYYTEEGWYIDDVMISDASSSVTIPDGDLKPVPVVFALGAPGPNPAVAGSGIEFDVPHPARVAIVMYDVTGRLVGTVADSRFEPGRYFRSIDTRALAPGVYFVNMRAAAFNATRKLIVVE
jgi:hypothetical protein